jgi:hypothetical protein
LQLKRKENVNKKNFFTKRRKVKMTQETRTILISKSNIQSLIETFLRTDTFHAIKNDEDVDIDFDLNAFKNLKADVAIPIQLTIKKRI